MAVIQNQGTVSDGYDVTVFLTDGSRHVFHFLTPPVDVQASVDALEASLPVEDTYEIEGE